eukprot:gnl/MRDRNA2_/MRDRNA2_98368_c0_seq1.p1 gnl/MRDRNA2_/MRDRNA2_98368_c0~~gnl/MRDRNA2_/MRDRNA2_98368_c0_seq1.p1  ORF type:complete len:333 (+),score=78.50 gnl/MRDRNA2_/MRDRNA2_98368_c0_seq1:107-1105(+)
MPPRKSKKHEAVPRSAETTSEVPSGTADADVSTSGHGPFLTCMVTPKLTFSVRRQAQWRHVEDISQDELRTSFLRRFPTTVNVDFSRLSFCPAVPPSTELTEDMQMLVFKVVSEDVAEDRVMLKIIQELERAYEIKVQESVAEERKQMESDSLSFQSLVDEVKRDHAEHVNTTARDNRELRDQLQSIQKRLFLVEQEKDQLLKEHVQLRETISKGEVEQQVEISKLKDENEDLRSQIADMRSHVHGALGSSGDHLSAGSGDGDPSTSSASTAALEERVAQLTQQIGSLQVWLQQGSNLLGPLAAGQVSAKVPSEAAVSRPQSGNAQRKKGKH